MHLACALRDLGRERAPHKNGARGLGGGSGSLRYNRGTGDWIPEMSHWVRRPQAGLSLRSLLVSLAALGALALTGAPSRSAASARADDPAAPAAAPRLAALPLLRQQAQDEGTVRVIVELDASFTPEGELRTEAKVEEQQQEIEQVQQELLESLPPTEGEARTRRDVRVRSRTSCWKSTQPGWKHWPTTRPWPTSRKTFPLRRCWPRAFPSSAPMTPGHAGYTGAGQVIAILDTGVDKNARLPRRQGCGRGLLLHHRPGQRFDLALPQPGRERRPDRGWQRGELPGRDQRVRPWHPRRGHRGREGHSLRRRQGRQPALPSRCSRASTTRSAQPTG